MCGNKIWIQDYMLQAPCCVPPEQFMLYTYCPAGGEQTYFNCVSDTGDGVSSCLSRWFVSLYIYIYARTRCSPEKLCSVYAVIIHLSEV